MSAALPCYFNEVLVALYLYRILYYAENIKAFKEGI